MAFPYAITLDWEELMTERSATNQKWPLGTVGRTIDGRAFRYAKAGAGISLGAVLQSPAAQIWSYGGTSGPFALDSGSTQTSTWRELCIESTFTTAVAADYFKDGYLYVTSTGRYVHCGQMLQIKSSRATTANSTLTYLTIADGQHLTKTLNTSDVGFALMRNPYDAVVEVANGAAPTGEVVGVSPITVTSGYYFWLQTWGLAPVEAAEASTTVGSGVVFATDTASTGAVASYSTTGILGYGSIGTVQSSAIASAYFMVNLRIQP